MSTEITAPELAELPGLDGGDDLAQSLYARLVAETVPVLPQSMRTLASLLCDHVATSHTRAYRLANLGQAGSSDHRSATRDFERSVKLLLDELHRAGVDNAVADAMQASRSENAALAGALRGMGAALDEELGVELRQQIMHVLAGGAARSSDRAYRQSWRPLLVLAAELDEVADEPATPAATGRRP